jgi:hypothetical protein
MNINRIQTSGVVPTINRSLERVSGRDNAAGRGINPDPPSLVVPGSSGSVNDAQSLEAQTQVLLTRINYTKDQLDKILTEYPPFFPAGTYQRTDLIRGIRGIQDAVEHSSVQSDLKTQIAAGKVDENATDGEIAVALTQLLNLKDELRNSLPMVVGSPKPGSVVSFKV